jgi:hypothetical protein
MKRIPMPDRFDGLKYFNLYGDYPSQSQPGTLDVPDHIESVDDCVTTVDDLKSAKIESLWSAATAYETHRISGSAPTKIGLLADKGNVKAQAIEAWVTGLWALYYERRQIVVEAETIEALEAVSEDFSSVGDIPYTVFETIFGS